MKIKMGLTSKIVQYQEEIHKRNCKNFRALTLGGTIITAAIVVFGALFSQYTEFTIEYGGFFLYMFLMHLLSIYCDKRQVKHINCVYYLAITPVLLGGVMMGTFLDADQPAITIMILLCIMTLFIIDRSVIIIGYMIAISAVFAICCYLAKDARWFMADMVDLAIYLCISIGINFFMLKGHVESVENYCMVQYKSEHDTLTGLLNRGSGEEQTMSEMKKGVPGAFIMLDIDKFKKVNDTYGHQVGDEVICEIARILSAMFRENGIVFRLGGDEFAIYASLIVSEQVCENLFESLKKEAKNIHTSNAECTSTGISIGCTICSGNCGDFESVYRSSDRALYDAKESGRGKYVIKFMTE